MAALHTVNLTAGIHDCNIPVQQRHSPPTGDWPFVPDKAAQETLSNLPKTMRANSSFSEHQTKQKKPRWLITSYFNKKKVVWLCWSRGGSFSIRVLKQSGAVRPIESNHLEKPRRRDLEVTFISLPNIECASKMKHVFFYSSSTINSIFVFQDEDGE